MVPPVAVWRPRGYPTREKLPGIDLTDRVRSGCREIAERARSVSIVPEGLAALETEVVTIEPAQLDPERHYLEGTPEDVAAYLLVLDSINFGSGWFPTLRKRPGCSGYYTVAWGLAERWRGDGPWSTDELAALDAAAVAAVLGQDPAHELMALYARALRELGAFLGDRSALGLVREAGGSAVQLASMLASGMPLFDDVGFWKRAQIVPNDLALAGVASFEDLDRLTIFADNLVPHVLRMDGVLRYSETLAARIDGGELLPAGSPEEREIRACSVHACERISAATAVPARALDTWLWNRGQAASYKAVPRHRTRTVYY
jgi:Potential Queuosine, Q, salvage protein family